MIKHRLRKRHSAATEEADVSLTPMLDVVFILLIFFIVTASFVKETGIEITRPLSETASKQENTAISVAIDEQGEVWVDGQRIDVRMLRSYIEKAYSGNPQSAVVVIAHRASRNAALITVLDQIRLAGVDDIAIAADTKR